MDRNAQRRSRADVARDESLPAYRSHDAAHLRGQPGAVAGRQRRRTVSLESTLGCDQPARARDFQPGFSCIARRFTPGQEDPDVKRNNSSQLPLHDYRHALQNAVSWLGQRYLLAEPVQKRREESKPFFVETPRW